MNEMDIMEVDDVEEQTASNSFVFSRPNTVFDLPRASNFGTGSDYVFDSHSTRKNIFTFAAPTIMPESDQSHTSSRGGNHDRYKPNIARTIYKPTSNMFTSALKGTEAFERLKKNSRSQTTKINIDNAITCHGVPKALLTKLTAKEYFTKYGRIVKINIRPKRYLITVIYASKEEANNAYYNCGDYMNVKFSVEWTTSELLLKSPTKKKDLSKNMVTNIIKTTDDEIESELKAMSNVEYNLHSNKGVEIPNINILLPNKTRVGKAALSHDKSTSKLEKAGLKVEKLETESQISKLLPNTSIEELQNIIHQVAFTAEDKYKVLEARDRLMKLKRVKPASLATAKATSGTCPDMCPEKERLMRESQRQVAPYELLEGNEYRINHATAIKQYSRSSADQEEPMPHELRPVRTLKMTMSYLLHEIVDLCEQEGINLAEWYHFLWDRTRGIRKDITQQELCCKDSVELIEQCARFHIVCSERLCAADASVFDKKINSENLTKCLQTLKYMYHDLRVKSITCKNEPEFRAYIVLLNLNNGNFLYDLQQLPRHVQNSPEVQFAISVYFALDSNNYYKFFKLVRETTYLNACILLRYFNQVRMKALSVMVKAYCRSTSTAFPLYELMDILGFEDENEAVYFCDKVGLNVSNDDLYILLNRQNFSMPTVSIEQRRACNLIESKRITLNFSIGQCIAGEKMPEQTYKNHKPHNSFDVHGNLMPESINAADQNIDVSSNVEFNPNEIMEKETKKTSKLTSAQDKTQATISFAHIRKEPISINNESTNVSKSIFTFEPVKSNIIKTVTSEPDIFIGHKQKTFNVFENKPLLTTELKTIPDKRFDHDSATIDVTHSESTTTNNKHSTIFSSNSAAFSNNLFTYSPTFSKQLETPRNIEAKPPFAAAALKPFLAKPGSKNIFMKDVTPPSTVFSSNRFSTPISTQQPTSNANAAAKINPDTPVKKELVQKEASTMSETAKAKLEYEIKLRQIEGPQSEEIYNDLCEEIIHELCCDIVKDNIDRLKVYETLSEEIINELMGEVIHEMCDTILTTEISQQQKLQAMLLKIKNQIIAKCFDAWRQYTLKRKRQRQALEDTPVWLQKRSVEECARMLYIKGQEVVIRNMRKRQYELLEDVTDDTENLAPVEWIIHAGIRENLRLLDVSPLPNIFWKLVISWPDLSNRPILWHHKKIMNEYLYPDDFTMEPMVKAYLPNPYESLHVCIRHFEGFISEQYLDGADAFLFIADASEEYKSVAKRLTKTVLSRQKLMPIPLTFIVLGDGNLESQNESIVSELETLLESGYVSEYTIMFEKNLNAKVTLNLIQSAVLWLTTNKSPSNPLEMDYLHNVYDICLSGELWLRILGDSMFNKQLSNALKDPNFIIDLHNEAVNHLMDIILDPESMLYTSFAPEFRRFLKTDHTMPCGYEYFNETWKNDESRAKLEATMNSFLLPPWNAPWPITDVENLRRHIMNYCTEVLSDSNYNIVFCDIFSNFSYFSDNLQISSFVQILLHVIKEKINLLDGDQTVIYNKNHIKHFRTLPWWFKSNVLTEFMSRELNSTDTDVSNGLTKKKMRLHRSESDLDENLLHEEFNSLTKFCENMRSQVMTVYFSSKDLEKRLQSQQSQNVLFEKRLKNALLEEKQNT